MKNKDKKKTRPANALRRIFGKRATNVYFIPGMCYNCSVFDRLTLPKGFRRNYIEWLIPLQDETLEAYAYRMAGSIDTRRPFIIIGYSFGAVIMQEMNKFLFPQKSIIISSFKSKDEIPVLFSAVRHTRFVDRVSKKLFEQTDFITNAFNKLVYKTTTDELSEFLTVTDPVYIRWAVRQITDWIPDNKSENLYHIHGTEDQIFPFRQIRNAITVEGGDHLMLVKKAETVSALLSGILLMKRPSSRKSTKKA